MVSMGLPWKVPVQIFQINMKNIIEAILNRKVQTSYTIEELTSLALDCFINSTHQPLKLKQNINFNFINHY